MTTLQDREKVKLRPILHIIVVLCLCAGLVLTGVGIGCIIWCDSAEVRVWVVKLEDPSGVVD